jgi:DNA-binding NarL/FixJ family response regulator
MIEKTQTISNQQKRKQMQSNQLTILVIDDSEIIRERLAEILSRIEGAQCIGKTRYASEGLDLVSLYKPDLVILDFKLHDRIGMDIVKKIKLISPRSIIIVMTNYPYSAYRIRCMSLGADYFLDKSLEFSRVKDIAINILTQGYQKEMNEA